MGRDREYTKAELAQQAKDQQDPRWLAWLADMDTQLGKFFTDTVPDMPANPWTAEGLAHAEAAALTIFPESGAEDLPENRDVSDQFHRFIGETFRRNFEGEWRNVPSLGGGQPLHGFGPVVLEPYVEMYLDVIPIFSTALFRRSGNELSFVFERSADRYRSWVDGGRLPLDQWVEVRPF